MIEIKKKIAPLFISIGAIVIFIAPLIHIDFPKKTRRIFLIEKSISKEKESFKLEYNNLKEDLKKGVIDHKSYVYRINQLIDCNNVKSIELKKKLENEIDKNRVFGFRSLRVFLIGFGIRLPYLLFSTAILFFYKYSYRKLKRNYYLKISIILLYNISFLISFYMIIWFLIPRKDFSLQFYHLLIIIISILSTIFSIYLIKSMYRSFNKSKNNIQKLIRFILSNRKEYILDIATRVNLNVVEKREIKKKLKNYDEQLFDLLKDVDND